MMPTPRRKVRAVRTSSEDNLATGSKSSEDAADMSRADWESIEAEIAPHHAGTRTASAALLAWFLHVVWRLDLDDVDDAICDGPGDKGIDGLVVNDDLREITLFQAKHRSSAGQEQGDAALKALVGAAAYFDRPESVDRLLASGPNAELRRLLSRTNVRERVANGSHVSRAVMVTNGRLDVSGQHYVQAMEGGGTSLEVWDADQLAAVASRTRRPNLRPEPVTLASVAVPTVVDLTDETKMAIALVPASELLGLPGIDDLTIFGRNVRLGLGHTRVNRELQGTVREVAEHPLFPAYHNGMTLLTQRLSTRGNELNLDQVAVVNGAQSLLALHADRTNVTPDLRVLVKVVQVDPQSDLADTITYRTNNQNAVDIRDQRSTDVIQRDLQHQVRELYGGRLGFAIRDGERLTEPETLDNQTAAQLLMAIYVNEPWNAVRKVRLFDQDYHRIFSREVDAARLFFIHELNKIVVAARGDLRQELQASFASIRLTLAYLVSRVLMESDSGKELLAAPDKWLPDRLDDVRASVRGLLDDVIGSVNLYVEDKSADDEDFDAKVVFKSQAGVRGLEADVMKSSRRQARRDEGFLFNVPPVR